MSWLPTLESLVEERVGVRLGTGAPALERVIEPRLAQLQLSSPEGYLALLAGTAGHEGEWQWLLGRILNGHTWFFRHPTQLDALGDALEAQSERGPVHIWCAACSTGEEAYSIAMLFESRGVEGRVLATDVSEEALRTARAGRFHEHSLRALSAADRERWFVRHDEEYEVAAAVRARVDFRLHNLLDPAPAGPANGFTAVVCRNVLIYFEPERAEATARRLRASLEPGGTLLLGPSEALALDPSLLAAGPRARLAEVGPPAPMRSLPEPPPPSERPVSSAREEAKDALAAEASKRALAHLRAGEDEDAAAGLRGVLFLEPSSWRATYLLATLLRRRGDLGEAARLYSRTLLLLSRRDAETGAPLLVAEELAPDQVRDACERVLQNMSRRSGS